MESIFDNLQTITLFFNFIGTLVIIASLWYLAKQTKLTNKIAAGESERELFDSYNEIVHNYSDLESIELLQRAFADYHALSLAEKARFNMIYIVPHINNFEQFYQLHRLNLMNEARVETTLNLVISMLRTQGGKEAWTELRHGFNPEIVAYIEKRSENSSVPPLNEIFHWFQIEKK